MGDKHQDRIPHNSLGDDVRVSAWDLPFMDDSGRVIHSAKKERDKKESENTGTNATVEIETVEEQGSQSPYPTVEELQQITEEARQEGIAAGFTEGIQKGLDEGRAKGLQLGQDKAYKEHAEQLSQQIQRFTALADSLFDPVEQQQAHLEKIIVDMAMHFAKHVMQQEIQQSPDALFQLVHNAMQALPLGADGVRVYVNAADAELIEQTLPADNRDWVVKVDASITSGGCRIETKDSLVDYTVETKLKKFLEQVQARGDITEDKVAPPAFDAAPMPEPEPESEIPADAAPLSAQTQAQEPPQAPEVPTPEPKNANAQPADHSAEDPQ